MTVDLNVEVHGEGPPLVVLHGLFGSGENWRTLARGWAAPPPGGAGRQVLAVDLRNHGRSPWTPTMTFGEMAADVVHLLAARGLARAAVLGHSLGGKVAMTLALAHPDRVERLIVVDIAPRAYPGVQEDVLEAMRVLDLSTLGSRGEADRRLAERLADRSTRQFLLKSLTTDEDGGYRWRLNLDAIAAATGDLRVAVQGPAVEVPTLVLRGERSRYVEDADLVALRSLFPRSSVATVAGAGHWVHADQPAVVAELVRSFLASTAADVATPPFRHE
jgi:esterase